MHHRPSPLLRAAVAVTGLTFAVGLYPLTQLWSSGWSWGDASHSHYPLMVDAVYFVLGVFLVVASRDPLRHRSLLWFAVWSSAAHAAMMALQAATDSAEHSHWVGDIPALLIVSVLLAVLLRREEQAVREAAA
ncbi:MAG: hypothetical protein DMD35_21390 [Gemmatimonadetes bacterium]|nr:MAG: hypothetical protein DMD35_21390 [Gemmatimonadota bacterium]